MADEATIMPDGAAATGSLRRVVVASSLGTVFEFYDFYLYGSLAAVIAQRFFTGLDPTSAFIAALLAFASGLLVRPFGSLVFGSIGDRIGRKYGFLVTLVIMGLSTFLVGCLPDYAAIGGWAPALLVALRMLQGLAIGGEYGGAITYVAEHAPAERRGFVTSWIQTTGSLGLLLSLVVIAACRLLLGDAFDDWGWRIPFLLSGILLGISIYIRLRLEESPVFQAMKEQGRLARRPVRQALLDPVNRRLVILAIFGATLGQAMVTYAGQIYTLYFLTVTLKLPDLPANAVLAAGILIGTPFCLLFGRLSDRIGRKPVLLAGCAAAALSFFPVFHGLTQFANPALARAMAAAPVRLAADPAECSVQFDPIGKRSFTSSCDVARSALARAGISYAAVDRPEGGATITLGGTTLAVPDGRGLTAEAFARESAAFRAALDGQLRRAGYPAAADPADVQWAGLVALIALLTIFQAAVYGPIAAWLVELFPANVRYTSLSLPYHIGNGWFGGFLPTTAFAIVTATGDIYSGLWYPIIGSLLCVAVGWRFLPETAGISIDAKAEPARA